jgi:hypothetical protein
MMTSKMISNNSTRTKIKRTMTVTAYVQETVSQREDRKKASVVAEADNRGEEEVRADELCLQDP